MRIWWERERVYTEDTNAYLAMYKLNFFVRSNFDKYIYVRVCRQVVEHRNNTVREWTTGTHVLRKMLIGASLRLIISYLLMIRTFNQAG